MKTKPHHLIAAIIAALTLATSAQEAAKPNPKPAENKPGAPAQTLPEVVVTAQTPTYAPPNATTATKLDVPLKDIPASVQVVPKELLQDRGVTRVEQMVENVSGIHAESSYGGNGATFFNIRGFTASNALRDGFRNYGYIATRDVQNIERIEVLKGPAGALYGGVGSLGGSINTVSKRPEAEAFGELGFTAGSYGLFRPVLDWNAPLGGGVSARLNGAYEHNDTFRDQGGYESFSIAPAIRWDIGPDTSLTLLMEYNRMEREGFDFGVPNVRNYRDLSRTRYYGLTGDFGENDTYAGTLLFEHKLSTDWTWRVSAHASQAHQFSNQTFPDLGAYTGGSLMPFYTYIGSDEDSADYAMQTELVGTFATGVLKHHAIFGVEAARVEHGYGGTPYYGLTLDLFDANFRSALGPKIQYGSGEAVGDNFGLYLQDLVDLTPELKLLAGLRADWFESRVYDGGQQVDEASQFELSPRVGLVWQPVEATSLYVSWSKSHAPNIGHSVSNSTFDAEVAEQFEVGVKQDIIKDRLSVNLAAYDLAREGILTDDPNNPLKQIQTGKQRSRGIELDLAGKITPAWKVIASYAYTDAEVRSDTFLPLGDALSNVPQHSGSLWSTYQFQDGPLKGFGLGAGLYYVGNREANLPNTYSLPGYWRTDATLFYERNDWKFQVNFLNVFDKNYYTGGETGSFNYTLNPSQPFSVQASITYKF